MATVATQADHNDPEVLAERPALQAASAVQREAGVQVDAFACHGSGETAKVDTFVCHDSGETAKKEVGIFEERRRRRQQAVDIMVRVYGYDEKPGGFPHLFRDLLGCRDFSKSNLRKFMPRFAFSFVFYLVCVYINNLSQAWLQMNLAGWYESKWGYSHATFEEAQAWLLKHNPAVYKARWGDLLPSQTEAVQAANQPGVRAKISEYYENRTSTLYDLAFLYLPYVPSSQPADMFAGISVLLAWVRFVFFPGPMSIRWTFLCRFNLIWGCLFLARGVCIIVTPLPNPFHECVPKVSYPNNVWAQAYKLLPGVGDGELTCQDVMFSGHTAMGTLGTLFLMTYMKPSPWFRSDAEDRIVSVQLFVDVLGIVWLLFGWYVITASHFHYTVDVAVGALLTFVFFSFYHIKIKTIWLEKDRPCGICLGAFLRWYEMHSLDLKTEREVAARLPLVVENVEELEDAEAQRQDEEVKAVEEDGPADCSL